MGFFRYMVLTNLLLFMVLLPIKMICFADDQFEVFHIDAGVPAELLSERSEETVHCNCR